MSGTAACLMCGWESGPIPAETVTSVLRAHMCPTVPPVVITLPPSAVEGAQVLVRHEWGGVHVDVREHEHHAWCPIDRAGGSFTVRSQ